MSTEEKDVNNHPANLSELVDTDAPRVNAAFPDRDRSAAQHQTTPDTNHNTTVQPMSAAEVAAYSNSNDR